MASQFLPIPNQNFLKDTVKTIKSTLKKTISSALFSIAIGSFEMMLEVSFASRKGLHTLYRAVAKLYLTETSTVISDRSIITYIDTGDWNLPRNR